MNAITTIVDEITRTTQRVNPDELGALADAIVNARHIHTAGAGRSGLMTRALANRLTHLGLSAAPVGDVTAPHSAPGDLVLIGSGSGSTASLAALAERAKYAALSVVLITATPDSPIGKTADIVLTVPAPSKEEHGSIQPMASLFEQSCLVVYDALVLSLMERLGETGASMLARHADLE